MILFSYGSVISTFVLIIALFNSFEDKPVNPPIVNVLSFFHLNMLQVITIEPFQVNILFQIRDSNFSGVTDLETNIINNEKPKVVISTYDKL